MEFSSKIPVECIHHPNTNAPWSAFLRPWSVWIGLSTPPLVAQRHAAKVGRRVMGELKQLEGRLVDAGLMHDD